MSKEFLQERADVIREKLENAALEFEREHGHVFAVNMCLHLGSSIILSNPDHLTATLETLRRNDQLRGSDPTTILTVAVLFYVLRLETEWAASQMTGAERVEKRAKAEAYKAKLKVLRSRLDAVNWLIGKKAMQVLEFD